MIRSITCLTLIAVLPQIASGQSAMKNADTTHEAHQRRSIELLVAAGVLVPRGPLADAASNGAVGTLGLTFVPKGSAMRFRVGAIGGEVPRDDETRGELRLLGSSLDLEYELPGGSFTPFILAGIGYFRTSTSEDESSGDGRRAGGFSLGGGGRFGVRGVSGVVESRYLWIAGSDSREIRLVPVMLGVSF